MGSNKKDNFKNDMMSAWCYFIKGSSCLTEEGRKALFKQSEVFKMAEVALKDLSVDNSVRVLEKLREKWVSDQVTHFEYAKQKGIEKGLQKGKAEGMQAGMQAGIEKGMQAVALNMLKSGFDLSVIAKMTGLSINEINKIKDNDSC